MFPLCCHGKLGELTKKLTKSTVQFILSLSRLMLGLCCVSPLVAQRLVKSSFVTPNVENYLNKSSSIGRSSVEGKQVIIRGGLMASKSLTFFDKKNLNWGGLKSGKKLSSVICIFTQQGHFVMSSCPQMKPENKILSKPRVQRRVFQLLRF